MPNVGGSLPKVDAVAFSCCTSNLSCPRPVCDSFGMRRPLSGHWPHMFMAGVGAQARTVTCLIRQSGRDGREPALALRVELVYMRCKKRRKVCISSTAVCASRLRHRRSARCRSRNKPATRRTCMRIKTCACGGVPRPPRLSPRRRGRAWPAGGRARPPRTPGTPPSAPAATATYTGRPRARRPASAG